MVYVDDQYQPDCQTHNQDKQQPMKHQKVLKVRITGFVRNFLLVGRGILLPL